MQLTQTSKNFDQTDFEHWQNILSTAKLKVGFPTDSSNDIINFLVYSDFLNFCQQPVRIMTTFAKTDIADVDNVNIEAILPLVTPAELKTNYHWAPKLSRRWPKVVKPCVIF